MRALRTHRVLSRRVFRFYYHCLRPLAYAKGGSGRLTVMAGFNDGWLEDTTHMPAARGGVAGTRRSLVMCRHQCRRPVSRQPAGPPSALS